MNQYEMVVLIVVVVMAASIVRSIFGGGRRGREPRPASASATMPRPGGCATR